MARVRKSIAIERLQRLVDEASELDMEDDSSQEVRKWIQDVYIAFTNIFGEDSSQFSRLPQSQKRTPSGVREYLGNMVSSVASGLDEIKYFWEDETETVKQSSDQGDFKALDTDRYDQGSATKKVFVVHGHEEAKRDAVGRFLAMLELEPIILHEQANKGRTIIEKFEDHADAGFAVVLLTPDDLGALAQDRDDLKPRARQNVILELGFFIGKLGRNRVCALKSRCVENPSDVDGMVYINLDEPDAWKTGLVRELKAAGFAIDANRVLQP